MMKNSEMPKAQCSADAVEARAARPLFAYHSSFVIRHSRPALTLIELLVTIVIMVTVLAGVLPLVSPNNNSRKIREASRQLNTFLSQAQAQAARDGRPVGVAFREFGSASPYSGVAMEAFVIASPPAFAGYSEFSQLRFRLQNGVVQEVQFVIAGPMIADPNTDPDNCYPIDEIPPKLLRYGDAIKAAGTTFVLMDQDQDGDGNADIAPGGTFKPGEAYVHTQPRARFQCRYIANLTRAQDVPLPPPTAAGPLLLPVAVPASTAASGTGWTTPRAYQVIRQPINTSDEPLQFPRGIAVDLQASGADGISAPVSFDSGVQDVVGVMFKPTGQIDALFTNGVQAEGVDQIYFLLGLTENGSNGSQDPNDYDFKTNPPADAADLADRRGRINWLNADSRWVSVNRAGRIITAENNINYEPWQSPYIDDLTGTADQNAREQRRRQINGYKGSPGARQSAMNMTGSTGR